MDIQWANDPLNPFYCCRRRLGCLLSSGRDGDLGPLYTWLPPAECAKLDAEVRELGQDFSAQVFWRFGPLREFPYSFGLQVHPKASDHEKGEHLHEFFRHKECCFEENFALRVHRLYRAVEALLRCPAFPKLVKTWVAAFKFTNMWAERLLARFRRNCRMIGAPDIERLVATSLLCQMLSDHLKSGRDDPRVQTKKGLLREGVPIQCQKKKQRASRPASTFFLPSATSEMLSASRTASS